MDLSCTENEQNFILFVETVSVLATSHFQVDVVVVEKETHVRENNV